MMKEPQFFTRHTSHVTRHMTRVESHTAVAWKSNRHDLWCGSEIGVNVNAPGQRAGA
jgi:hypothetical protein